mmetsp:Transcript_21938/g.55816  ORF Transcript_21938/g.55816 Transcript_21938/m.55816 type:complete len:212 (+) Transcript_21938:496-1131(+)
MSQCVTHGTLAPGQATKSSDLAKPSIASLPGTQCVQGKLCTPQMRPQSKTEHTRLASLAETRLVWDTLESHTELETLDAATPSVLIAPRINSCCPFKDPSSSLPYTHPLHLVVVQPAMQVRLLSLLQIEEAAPAPAPTTLPHLTTTTTTTPGSPRFDQIAPVRQALSHAGTRPEGFISHTAGRTHAFRESGTCSTPEEHIDHDYQQPAPGN